MMLDAMQEVMVKAQESLKLLKKEWKFVVYDSPVPNAFVHSMLPNMVFLSSGNACKSIHSTTSILKCD